jgi:hypothetical protein
MNDNEFWRLVVDVGEILLDHIENCEDDDDLLITYGEVARRLPYEFNPRNLDSPLGTLSDTCKDMGLPLISTIVVNQEEKMPGVGYFKYFFGERKKLQWVDIFIEQLNRVKECDDWTPLAEELGLE